jgi:hypothetical protein
MSSNQGLVAVVENTTQVCQKQSEAMQGGGGGGPTEHAPAKKSVKINPVQQITALADNFKTVLKELPNFASNSIRK